MQTHDVVLRKFEWGYKTDIVVAMAIFQSNVNGTFGLDFQTKLW